MNASPFGDCPVCYEHGYMFKYNMCTHGVCSNCMVRIRDDELYVCPLCRRFSTEMKTPTLMECQEIILKGDQKSLHILVKYRRELIVEGLRLSLRHMSRHAPYSTVTGVICAAGLLGAQKHAELCYENNKLDDVLSCMPMSSHDPCIPMISLLSVPIVSLPAPTIPTQISSQICGLHGVLSVLITQCGLKVNLLQYIMYNRWHCDGESIEHVHRSILPGQSMIPLLIAAYSIELYLVDPLRSDDMTAYWMAAKSEPPIRLIQRYIDKNFPSEIPVERLLSVIQKIKNGEQISADDELISRFLKICSPKIYNIDTSSPSAPISAPHPDTSDGSSSEDESSDDE